MIAGLIAVAGILLARGVFDVAVLAPEGEGTWGDADTGTYALYCGLAALVATGLLHLLLMSTPRPFQFFGWIISLATAVAALAPFATNGSTSSKIATGLINLVVGIAIGALLPGAARAAMRAALSAADASSLRDVAAMADLPGLRLMQRMFGRFADQLGGLEDADRSGYVHPVGTMQELGEAWSTPLRYSRPPTASRAAA